MLRRSRRCLLVMLRSPGCLQEGEDFWNQTTEAFISLWKMRLLAQMLGNNAAPHRQQKIEYPLGRQRRSNATGIDGRCDALPSREADLPGLLQALFRGNKPRNRVLKDEVVEIRLLLGEEQPGLKPYLDAFPDGLRTAPDAFLALTEETNPHPKQRIIERELARKVLVERWRLHAYQPSNLIEVEGSHSITAHDLPGRGDGVAALNLN